MLHPASPHTSHLLSIEAVHCCTTRLTLFSLSPEIRQRRNSREQTHAVRQDITMDMRARAIASLTFFLFIMASASADDVKIMGLMDTNAVRSDGTRPLTYLTGSCQQKHKRMKCHLNEIAVTKLDTTLVEAKAKEVMDQVKNDPHNVDSVL